MQWMGTVLLEFEGSANQSFMFCSQTRRRCGPKENQEGVGQKIQRQWKRKHEDEWWRRMINDEQGCGCIMVTERMYHEWSWNHYIVCIFVCPHDDCDDARKLHRNFCTQKILHTDAFTQRNFYTQTRLHTHRKFYTEKSLHRGTFTRRNLYTEEFFHTDAFTQHLLRTEIFTHKIFYPQKLFIRIRFLTEKYFTQRNFHTQKSLHNETFTQRNCCTQKRLHTEAFTHRSFYIEK